MNTHIVVCQNSDPEINLLRVSVHPKSTHSKPMPKGQVVVIIKMSITQYSLSRNTFPHRWNSGRFREVWQAGGKGKINPANEVGQSMNCWVEINFSLTIWQDKESWNFTLTGMLRMCIQTIISCEPFRLVTTSKYKTPWCWPRHRLDAFWGIPGIFVPGYK